jgi:hypothetical protein
MAHPLMPKATAVWLVENTALTFEQISEFCGLHALEVQAIADGEVATGMQGLDPIAGGELTQEELGRCADDPESRLEMAVPDIPLPKARQKGARYTPVSKRQDRPDAIAWVIKNHPELTDAQISKLIGTTKPTINAIRDRSHWNMPNIKPQNPVNLGLCLGADLEKIVAVARAKAKKVHESEAKPLDSAAKPPAPAETPNAPEPPAPVEAPKPVEQPKGLEALAAFAPEAPDQGADESQPPQEKPQEEPEQPAAQEPEPDTEPEADTPSAPPPTPEVLKEAENHFGTSPAETPEAAPDGPQENSAGQEPEPSSGDDISKET